MTKTGKIVKKTGKIILWILLSIFVLIVVAVIFINTTTGKNVVRNQVTKYLHQKLKTNIKIGEIDYRLPKWLSLKNVYIEDQKKDTLLFGEELSVDLDMIKLIKGNTDIKKVSLKNISININRPQADSFFNYQFIINAFSGNKSITVNKDTAEMKLSVSNLLFDNVRLNFRDSFAGNNFIAAIKNLHVTTTKFSPDRMNFGLENFYANGVQFFMNTYGEPTKISDKKIIADTTIISPYKLFINAKNVELRNLDVLVENKISGLYYANKIGNLSGKNILYSIVQAKGTADKLLLDSATIIFVAPKKITDAVKDSITPVAVPWLYAAKNLDIKNTQIKYDDNNKPAAGGLDFSHLDAKKINASVSSFRFSKDTATALISQFTFNDKSGFALDTTHLNFLFTDTLLSATDVYVKTPGSLIQKSFSLRYDSLAAITKSPQNTLISAVLNGTSIAFNDLYLLVPALQKSLPKAQFANQYLNLNTALRGNLQRLYIPYLQLSGLSGTKINASGTVFNITDPNKFSFDIIFGRSTMFKKDLLKFVPSANQKQLASLPDIINISGKFSGNKNNILADVSASAKDLSFIGKINLKNITDPKSLQYDLAISNASISKNLISGFLPPALLQQLNLPQQISAVGKFAGNTENIITDLRIGSSYGPLNVKGFIKNIKDPKFANYDLMLTTTGFALGRFIKQDTLLGTIAGKFAAKGTGFDYKTMRSSIKADVATLGFKKYNYHNASIAANFNNGTIRSTGKINDENLKLNYDIIADIHNEYPTAKGAIRVDTAQLRNLNLYKDTLNFSFSALVNAQNLRPRNLDATLFLDSLKLRNGSKMYVLDSTSLIASSQNGVDSIVLLSPFANAHAGGAFDYDKIATSLQQYINNYYKIPGYKPTLVQIPAQQFGIKGVIKNSALITGIVPGLTAYDDINFTGSYASANRDSALNFNAAIPRLVYNTNRINNGTININSKNGRINYEAKFDTLTTTSNTLYATTVNGGAAKDSISLNALTKDINNKNWFGLSGSAFVKDQTYSFRMQDSLILNYEKWNVVPDNYLSYSPQGIIVNNFVINSDTAKIAIRSKEIIPNSPIDIDINNFDLKSISSIVNRDTVLLAGVLDIKAQVSDLNKALPGFTGTATVKNLQVMQHPLGNITADARKENENEIAANLALLGFGNDVSVKGNYYLNNRTQQFNADVAVKQLSFKTLETFSAGQLKNTSGNISGNINANGKFTDPRWKGQLDFDTTSFTLTQLGTPYKIDKQKIVFEYPKIIFPQFTINDSLKHNLVIDGDVTIKSMTDIGLNIDVNTNNFVLINAKKAVSSQVYGYGAVDINVSVTGTAAAPNIDGDVSVNDKSDLTIVLPEANYAKNDGKTIVRFIDKDTFDVNSYKKGFEEEKKQPSAFAQFLNYNLNIEITKDASLSVLVDPVTGDMIKVQGDAKLNAGVDPGGNIVLAGTYELDNGYYDLHYQFLQRKFNLIKGSTITFTGAPLNAEVNINAAYIANTNSKDLLSNEITDASPGLANSFNQKIPYRVVLNITGPLNKPDIKFDIQLPEENSNLVSSDLRTTIDNKLQQIRSDPASINKQVFSLLLLGRFTGEQSSDFFKGSGGGFNDIARQSVSQFLSSALNEIAGDIIKGVDIDLNLNSYNDFTNGGNTQRTDLNVAVSKNFANNRLTVTVGQSFGIQGQDAASKAGSAGSGFRPDISIGYKLTQDGKYLLRAYTKNQFEATVDGYVVETGVAFSVAMDYEKFNELFRKKKSKK